MLLCITGWAVCGGPFNGPARRPLFRALPAVRVVSLRVVLCAWGARGRGCEALRAGRTLGYAQALQL
jgi:hypothetical protein